MVDDQRSGAADSSSNIPTAIKVLPTIVNEASEVVIYDRKVKTQSI